MDKVLTSLRNAKIVGIQQIHDYWQVITDKGGINIYNPVKYYTTDNDCHDLENSQLDDILNHVIVGITAEELKYLSFELDNNSLITVSLADNDYNGPEAFDIHLDTGEIIVG
ncbi:MAG: hypothetical protein VR72_00285 [Clostridiaceae bacterium BRH_c20a]|nr:MAG: hypothetical protein VR72_00285 [Clostridiaceae bacterium BRH_c20a]